jgi:CBS domain-containing protein
MRIPHPIGEDSVTLGKGWDVNVRDVMSGHPVWVTPETDVVSVGVRMSEHALGAFPVCERGRLVGIITDRDIVFRYLARGSYQSRLVGHYMTRDPVTIGPEEALERAEALMAQHHLRRLPVCEGGRLVGMVTRGDLARRTSQDPVGEAASAASAV